MRASRLDPGERLAAPDRLGQEHPCEPRPAELEPAELRTIGGDRPLLGVYGIDAAACALPPRLIREIRTQLGCKRHAPERRLRVTIRLLDIDTDRHVVQPGCEDALGHQTVVTMDERKARDEHGVDVPHRIPDSGEHRLDVRWACVDRLREREVPAIGPDHPAGLGILRAACPNGLPLGGEAGQ